MRWTSTAVCEGTRAIAVPIATGVFIAASILATRAAAAEPGLSHLPRVVILDLDSLQQHVARVEILPDLPNPADFGVEEIVAFEGNYDFIYLAGASHMPAEAVAEAASTSRPRPTLLRRLFILKPSLVVVEDRVHIQGRDEFVWEMKASFPLALHSGSVVDAAGGKRFRCLSLLPESGLWGGASIGRGDGEGAHAGHAIRTTLSRDDHASTIRLLQVMGFANGGDLRMPHCSVQPDGSVLRLKMVAPDDVADMDRVVELLLPADGAAGKVRISDPRRRVKVPMRLLPGGILPPGAQGLELRMQWDLPYQMKGRATWDTGRPSSELKRLVEGGTIQPCRTVELGCGTGNDAIYLASKSFDVTAIDISPAALRIAEKKAEQAGVKVHWVLADVLQPPPLGPFDFVYDRGCYHEVRQHHPQEYLSAVKNLTRKDSRILILAGNANQDSYWRFHGPPRVKEEEIRSDFARGFRLLSLKEFRFDPAPPDTQGALAWSVLLEREVEE